MRLFTSKKRSFQDHLEHERRSGYLWDESPDGQWFVSGSDLSEVKESQSLVLSLYTLRKGLGSKIGSVYNIEKNTIFIGDISSEIENKGYGSILMVNIIKIAKILKARTITGNLAETDSDHFDKLEHFYIKHGFIVSISDSGKTGTVYLRMPCKTHSCEEKEGSIK